MDLGLRSPLLGYDPDALGRRQAGEIKRLYYRTSRATIKEDFAKAIDLLKSMSSEEERERVAVYMDGLSQMRSDWAGRNGARSAKTRMTEGR